jgi:hypothetical protein
MPLGILVMKWEERSALIKKAQYPPNKDLFITEKTFLHLLNLHGFSEEPGMITLTIKDVNLITFYSGVHLNYYIILVLNLLEDVEDFEQKFKEIAIKILENLEDESLKELLAELYEKYLLS